MSFIDLVPKSGAGVDSSSEESPAASPAPLPKSRGTSKNVSCEYLLHVSHLMLKVEPGASSVGKRSLRSGCKSAGALVHM